jgi:MFS family permease
MRLVAAPCRPQDTEVSSPASSPLPTQPPHHPEPSQLARRLGHAGLAPFVLCALFIWLLAGRVEDEPFSFVVAALTSYAALVLAFLGGIPWGLIMWQTGAGMPPPPHHDRALWTGLLYVTGAWIGLLMPPHAGLVVLGALLIACYLTDRKRYPELGVSAWLTLRFRLTVVASLCCFLAAAQL